MKSIAISVVSHGQGELIKNLLDDLQLTIAVKGWDVTLMITLNIKEDESFLDPYKDYIVVIRNQRPMGFGKNHNQAFALSNSEFFLILNPDIRLAFPISELIESVISNEWGCMAPLIVNMDGEIEDSARNYPTIFRILNRVVFKNRNLDYCIKSDSNILRVNWVAGMFIVFRASAFKSVGGFNEAYFMYLEDTDICRNLNSAGCPVLLNPKFVAQHDAQRKTLKNIRHLKWHIISLVKFLFYWRKK
jgi:GT2 family glycosyltransferase